eukprot:tig00000169_g11896.t1
MDDGTVAVGPFPGRGDTMYLQKIENQRPKHVRQSLSLETGDISGAQPKKSLVVDGMPGKGRPPPEAPERSSPMRLHPTVVNRPSYINVNEDIEGTKPFNKKALRTNRHIDPLQPEYKLPSAPPVVPPEVPQRRITNQLDDMPLSHPKALVPRTPPRDIMNVADIVGEPKRARWSSGSGLDVSDIVNQEFKTARVLNIMSPRYCYDVPAAVEPAEWEIGEIEKNHPRKLKPGHPPPFLPLHTADIDGCAPDTGLKKAQEEFANGVRRRHFRNTNFLGDIRGTHPSDRRPFSKRCTNPLDPAYPLLDERPRERRTPQALSTIRESGGASEPRAASAPAAGAGAEAGAEAARYHEPEVLQIERPPSGGPAGNAPPTPDIEMHVPSFSTHPGGGGGGGLGVSFKPPTPLKPRRPSGAPRRPASPRRRRRRPASPDAGAGRGQAPDAGPGSRRGSGIVDDLRAEIAAVRALPDF